MRSLYLLPFFLLFLSRLDAATYTVTTNTDSGAGSLRQAITDLNSSADSSNTISIASLPGTITLASDLPVIQKPVTISATGSATVSGNNLYRVFATTADLSIQNCTVQNGLALGGAGAAGLGSSGSASCGGGGGGAGMGGGALY